MKSVVIDKWYGVMHINDNGVPHDIHIDLLHDTFYL